MISITTCLLQKMSVLSAAQRSQLENTVIQARRRAEAGGRNALVALAVDQADFFPHLSDEQKELRRRLRAKARVLGDSFPAKDGVPPLLHLSQELAYEYWHQMLFARFLEANDLLMYAGPEESLAEATPVSLDDAVALRAEDLGVPESSLSKWSAASALASRMLPAIFRLDDPLLQVAFAPDDRIKLESLLDSLDAAIFRADDALGWVYQFWQSDAKAAINASGAKIDGARLPAVTQLFTEPYMVQFLLDNTLGAWWTAHHPGEAAPVALPYLRRLPDGQPAAGTFAGWPATTAQVTLLDPCMGSGHFVAAAFPLLARLRMHEEGLSAAEATDRVLTDNLHGLELDARCTQIAAFNLALTAWKFCGGYRPLPPLNLACSGLAPTGKREDWERLATGLPDATRLHNGLGRLYDLFQQAPELGSLIDPTAQPADAFTASFEELRPVLELAISQEHDRHDDEQAERGVVAQGIALAGRLLAQKYTLVITNVPYLKRGKQSPALSTYADKHCKGAKGDLATIFLYSFFNRLNTGSTISIVSPHNWLYLGIYQSLRKFFITNSTLNLFAILGTNAFETISGEVVNVDLQIISHNKPKEKNKLAYIDSSTSRSCSQKADSIREDFIESINQIKLADNPDSRIVFSESASHSLLNNFGKGLAGCFAGDSKRFECFHWEVNLQATDEWEFLQSTVNSESLYSGRTNIVFWQKEEGEMYNLAQSVKHLNHAAQNWLRGKPAWGNKGVVISQMGSLSATLYSGDIYDCNCCAIIPNKQENLLPLWCFAASGELQKEVRKIDQSIKVTPHTLLKVPFDLAHWQKVATEQYPNGLPLPYSDDPTQWLFHGHPEPSPAPLQVALARLLGYRWPAETDEQMELDPRARQLSAAIAAHNGLSDQDGILCLPAVNGELAAAEALRQYLQAVYGAAYTPHTLDELLRREGSAQADLAGWLREEFFGAHCKLFGQRPFLWHIWDGRKDGFAAVVNYHKLTKATLSKLIYTYLGDYLRQVEQQQKHGESGAEGRLVAARALEAKLKVIYEGEAPYDIFVRWKPLARQPLGWDPDLNDGVRLNIRPFMTAEVLRRKPGIKWGVDRGKNPPSAPWGETRDNDQHTTLAEKRAAQA